MNFRCRDNRSDSLEPGYRDKVVAMWDMHPKPTPRECDVIKAGTAARPRGGDHPEGVRNATKTPQIEHSHQRQQTLIATTLCVDTQLLGHQSFTRLITL